MMRWKITVLILPFVLVLSCEERVQPQCLKMNKDQLHVVMFIDGMPIMSVRDERVAYETATATATRSFQ